MTTGLTALMAADRCQTLADPYEFLLETSRSSRTLLRSNMSVNLQALDQSICANCAPTVYYKASSEANALSHGTGQEDEWVQATDVHFQPHVAGLLNEAHAALKTSSQTTTGKENVTDMERRTCLTVQMNLQRCNQAKRMGDRRRLHAASSPSRSSAGQFSLLARQVLFTGLMNKMQESRSVLEDDALWSDSASEHEDDDSDEDCTGAGGSTGYEEKLAAGAMPWELR